MMLNRKKILSMLWLVFVCLTAFSIGSQPSESESTIIARTLKAQWDKPGQPLVVPVIVMRGDYAIADWMQKPSGGRALLRRNKHVWQTLLCGDINLTKKFNLVRVGVPEEDAAYLSTALMQAEMSLSEEDKALVNSFKGIVDLLMEPQHHAH